MGAHSHQVSYNLDEKFTITPRIRSTINRFFIFGGVLLVLGIIFAIVFPGHHDTHAVAGHHAHHSSALVRRIFASLLQNGFMFMGVGLLATFFIAIQSVANAGWATTFRRVPEAFGHFLPIAYAFIILFFIGAFATHSLHDFYHWTDAETVAKDELLKAKSGYLNIPFFLGRTILFFAIWFFLFKALRDLSLKEDQIGGLDSFDKAKVYSCIYIAVFALSYSAASWDWIMSLEAHWFSTMFGVYTFASTFVMTMAIIALFVIYLKLNGFLSYVNESHIHDLGKFVFAFSIFWAYIFVSQFLLIWYANIPEETMYFWVRWKSPYKVLFFLNIILNFVLPFLVLMTRHGKRKLGQLAFVCGVVILGHWLDFYLLIMPGPLGEDRGFLIEFGMFLLTFGLFALYTAKQLEKYPLVPKNHPYLKESLIHEI